jgi:hypothetical protein
LRIEAKDLCPAPFKLNERDLLVFAAPVFREGASMLAVGLSERRTFGDVKAITALWRRFGPEVGGISNKAHFCPVGILTRAGEDDGYSYACVVLVRDLSAAPPTWRGYACRRNNTPSFVTPAMSPRLARPTRRS